jgi:hypothetical protein
LESSLLFDITSLNRMNPAFSSIVVKDFVVANVEVTVIFCISSSSSVGYSCVHERDIYRPLRSRISLQPDYRLNFADTDTSRQGLASPVMSQNRSTHFLVIVLFDDIKSSRTDIYHSTSSKWPTMI